MILSYNAPSELIVMLRLHEGVKTRAYQDTLGNWTVGVGRNLQNPGLSRDEVIALLRQIDLPLDIVDLLLKNDTETIAHQVAGVVGDVIWNKLDEVRQAALVDMGFAGPAKLARFTKMIAALAEEDWHNAYVEALNSKWAIQVGPERSRMVANMLYTGQWPSSIESAQKPSSNT